MSAPCTLVEAAIHAATAFTLGQLLSIVGQRDRADVRGLVLDQNTLASRVDGANREGRKRDNADRDSI